MASFPLIPSAGLSGGCGLGYGSPSPAGHDALPAPSDLYVVNDKGFLTVRPPALRSLNPKLAAEAAATAAELLRTHAPERLDDDGAGGGPSFALSMMASSTNVLWWHLGPYDDCPRSQRMWVSVSGGGTCARLKLPGDRTAHLLSHQQDVAKSLHAFTAEVVNMHRAQRRSPASLSASLPFMPSPSVNSTYTAAPSAFASLFASLSSTPGQAGTGAPAAKHRAGGFGAGPAVAPAVLAMPVMGRLTGSGRGEAGSSGVTTASPAGPTEAREGPAQYGAAAGGGGVEPWRPRTRLPDPEAGPEAPRGVAVKQEEVKQEGEGQGGEVVGFKVEGRSAGSSAGGVPATPPPASAVPLPTAARVAALEARVADMQGTLKDLCTLVGRLLDDKNRSEADTRSRWR